MATDQLEILNNALTHLGERRVSSASEGKAVRDLSASFDIVRKETLRQYPFPFARSRVQLTAGVITAVYDTEFDYVFAKPSDWLKTVELSHNGDFENGRMSKYLDEGQNIYCDYDTAYMWYVKDHSTYSEWDAIFDNLMALELAQHCAFQITDSKSLSEIKMRELGLAQKRAYAVSARDLGPQKRPMGNFRKSRYGAGFNRSYAQF